MINFELIDPNVRASQVFIELQGQRRTVGGDLIPQIGLIPGQYDQSLAGGITDYVPVQVFSADEVAEKAGFGSEAHRQALWVFGALGGFYDNMWWVPIPEPGGAVKANEDIVFTSNATSSGTFFFSIGGDFISIAIANGDTPTEIGDKLVTAITANLNGSVTAANALGTVTVTAKTAGVNGNQIKLVLNPSRGNESLNPTGTTVTMPGSGGYLSSGAGVTDVHDMFFNSSEEDILGDRFYTQIAGPYNDSTNLGYYKDSWTARKSPDIRRIFNACVGYVKEDYATAFGIPATINSEGISPMWESRSLSPNWELQAAVMGLIMWSATFDPGRPFKTLSTGIPMEQETGDLSYAKNDALFRAGMGYFKSVNGSMVAGDLALSYRTTGGGAPTEEWFDTVSISRRQQKVYDMELLFRSSPYDRSMVADNDSISAKTYVIKPKKVISDFAALVDVWAAQGWTKNATTVKASIAAEINATNNSRIDTEITDDPAQALRIIAVLYKFLY